MSDDSAHRLRRQRHYAAGRRAETIAALWLTLHGYRVLARRYGVSGGELDLVVTRGSTVAFVEVKARSSLDAAFDAMTVTKQRRIARAAAVWLARNPWAARFSLRGDLVLIAPWRLPRHQRSAFPLDRKSVP